MILALLAFFWFAACGYCLVKHPLAIVPGVVASFLVVEMMAPCPILTLGFWASIGYIFYFVFPVVGLAWAAIKSWGMSKNL